MSCALLLEGKAKVQMRCDDAACLRRASLASYGAPARPCTQRELSLSEGTLERPNFVGRNWLLSVAGALHYPRTKTFALRTKEVIRGSCHAGFRQSSLGKHANDSKSRQKEKERDPAHLPSSSTTQRLR